MNNQKRKYIIATLIESTMDISKLINMLSGFKLNMRMLPMNHIMNVRLIENLTIKIALSRFSIISMQPESIYDIRLQLLLLKLKKLLENSTKQSEVKMSSTFLSAKDC